MHRFPLCSSLKMKTQYIMETKTLEIPVVQKTKITKEKTQSEAAASSCCTPKDNTASVCCTPIETADDNGAACCPQPEDGSACCNK
jgi:hypothetical protein